MSLRSLPPNGKGDTIFSYTTWLKRVPCLLPKTQFIVFFDTDTKEVVANGAWEHVENVVGHRMKETDDYPVRYLVEEFPTKAELAAIGTVEFAVAAR